MPSLQSIQLYARYVYAFAHAASGLRDWKQIEPQPQDESLATFEPAFVKSKLAR